MDNNQLRHWRVRLIQWVVLVGAGTGVVFGQAAPTSSPCTQVGSLTAVTSFTAFTNSTNNPTCNVWALNWYTTGFSAITIQLEGSDDNSSWTAFTGASVVTTGTNPSSALSGTIKVSAVTKNAYLRVNLTAKTGTGAINFQLRGASGIVSQASPGGGGGGTCAALAGDVTGTCAANTVVKVNGGAIPVSATVTATNSSGQFIAAPLPSTDIWVGSAGNLPVARALSGDCTISNTGVITCPTRILSGSATFAYGAPICDGCCLQGGTTITVTGAASGDAVAIGATPSLAVGVNVNGKATSANTVTVEICNLTGASVTPGSTTYLVSISH